MLFQIFNVNNAQIKEFRQKNNETKHVDITLQLLVGYILENL